jgi:hypothetical protein
VGSRSGAKIKSIESKSDYQQANEGGKKIDVVVEQDSKSSSN